MKSSSRNTAIIIGTLVGAALGATAAWAYSTATEDRLDPQLAEGHQLRLKAGPADYAKVGVSLLVLIRQVADLFKLA